MADRNEQQPGGNVDAVTDLLVRGAQDRAHRPADDDILPTDDNDNSPDEGEDELPDDKQEGGDDDQHSDEGDDDVTDDDEGPDDESEADDDGEPDDEGEEGEDDLSEVAYDDDDIVEVTVDGNVQEVTLRDLKAAYSGEGAIEKRLKEATEARKEATTLRDTAIQQRETERTRLLQTIQQLDSALFAPMVEKPDTSLRHRDRQAYDAQLDAYEDDQKRIQTSRQQMQQFMQEQLQEQAKVRQTYRQEQQQVLVERAKIKSQQDAKAFQADVKLAADHYGFSEAQIKDVDNAGVFLMARDAARYIRLQQMKNKRDNSPSTGKTTKTRRKLKPGGPTSKKVAAQRQAKQRQEVTDRARSGKVGDVANMISANVRKRG